MDDLFSQALDTFPKWLASLGEDASALASLLTSDSMPDPAKRYVAGAINYLFKSLDIIPDGVEDLGYLDDAFVLRVAARIAIEKAPSAKETDIRGTLARLADDALFVEKVLEGDYKRFDKYVRDLDKGAARGRTVDEILGDPEQSRLFNQEVHAWCRAYRVPSFSNDEKNIIKLRSFFATKLP
jgi:uncharacterized membrane protein YkvA (DUF1232 family)